MLHNSEPVKPEAVRTELPQLLATLTVGAAGNAFTVKVAGLEFTVAPLLLHTARYCLLLSTVVTAKVSVPLVAPETFVQVVPLVLDCHCTVGTGVPFAEEVKLTLLPVQPVWDAGWVVTVGDMTLGTNTTSAQ